MLVLCLYIYVRSINLGSLYLSLIAERLDFLHPFLAGSISKRKILFFLEPFHPEEPDIFPQALPKKARDGEHCLRELGETTGTTKEDAEEK